MFRHNIFIILLFGSLCASVTTAGAEVIFSDSFETGDMSATNVDGFAWGKNNRTAIVTQDPIDGSVKLWDNGKLYETLSNLMPDGSDREYTAKDGKNSLRFRYAPNANWTEQRFDLGKGYPDIWISYDIRVPLNYHRGVVPPVGKNNKWMIILMSNMSNYNNKNITRLGISDYPSADESSIDLFAQVRIGNNRGYTSFTSAYKNFITPADAGRWMQIIYHLKANSAKGVDDGLFKMYRKWKNEKVVALISSIDPAPMPISQDSIKLGYNGWGGGYFLGWANSPYAEETDWLMDNVIISRDSLLPNPPQPPVKGEGVAK